MATTPAENEIVLPALLRFARGTFSHAIKRELAAGGFDDLPRNAPFVLGGMANQGGTAGDLIRQLGVTKQAASQLVDEIVRKGYAERRPHPVDARARLVVLTERGWACTRAAEEAAAEAVRSWTDVLGESDVRALCDRLGRIAPHGPIRPTW